MSSGRETGKKGIKTMSPSSVIGFDGSVPSGLVFHPEKRHLIYPTGNSLVVKEIDTNRQQFLRGHCSRVSCVDVSKQGDMIASGQINHMGFKGAVILWEWATSKVWSQYSLHRVKVEAVAFSPSGTRLASLGGLDDSTIIIYDVKKKTPLYSQTASPDTDGYSLCICFSPLSNDLLVSAGSNTLRVWIIDPLKGGLKAHNVFLNQIRRDVRCLQISNDDQLLYAGTTTGDILRVRLKSSSQLTPHLESCMAVRSKKGPRRYHKGVTALLILDSSQLLVGAGDGSVSLLKEESLQETKRAAGQQVLRQPTAPNLTEIKSLKLTGGVSSFSRQGEEIFIGTDKCDTYRLDLSDTTLSLVSTSHTGAISCLVSPHPNLLLSGGPEDARVWHIPTQKELLRIPVHSVTCNAVDVTKDGRYIVTGWSDGSIRCYTPESGKLVFQLERGHSKGISALILCSLVPKIISGGEEGQVRIWEMNPLKQPLLGCFNDHKGKVTSIRLRRDEQQGVSSSDDGTCIIWDLQTIKRIQVIFNNTCFKGVAYHPSEAQLVTVGSDRQVGWWEVYDGVAIRLVEGTTDGCINTVCVSDDGRLLMTGGADRIMKVWLYEDGVVTHCSEPTSGEILNLCITQDGQHIMAAGSDGTITFWNFPGI